MSTSDIGRRGRVNRTVAAPRGSVGKSPHPVSGQSGVDTAKTRPTLEQGRSYPNGLPSGERLSPEGCIYMTPYVKPWKAWVTTKERLRQYSEFLGEIKPWSHMVTLMIPPEQRRDAFWFTGRITRYFESGPGKTFGRYAYVAGVEPHRDGRLHAHACIWVESGRKRTKVIPPSYWLELFDESVTDQKTVRNLERDLGRVHDAGYGLRLWWYVTTGGWARVDKRIGRVAVSYALKYVLKGGGEWFLGGSDPIFVGEAQKRQRELAV